jgi:predicted aldo/keto reductase-like oxidoreductase
MEQVQDNLRIADKARIDAFTHADQELIKQVRKIYQERTAIPCTKCNYCMPCPSGVNIPANFDFFNYAHLYDNVPDARFRYGIFVPESQQAGACTECGSCESLCPQSIAISTLMPQVTALLA